MSDCIPCGCRDSFPTKELGIEEWKDEYLKLVIYTSAVSRENDKLRELVKMMHSRINYKCGCCSIFCPDWDKENDCCVFTTSMRDLGVVVD